MFEGLNLPPFAMSPCPKNYFGKGLNHTLGNTDGELQWFQDKWNEWETKFPEDSDGESYYAEYIEQQSQFVVYLDPKIKAVKSINESLEDKAEAPQYPRPSFVKHGQKINEALTGVKPSYNVATFFAGRVPQVGDGRAMHVIRLNLPVRDYLDLRIIAAKKGLFVNQQIMEWVEENRPNKKLKQNKKKKSNA